MYMSQVYSMVEFTKIKKEEFDYIIPDDARELITLLANLVGSPNYSKSPYFIKTDKKKKKTAMPSNMGWDLIRNYKKTELKEKDETEKKFDEIRTLMNKLTETNYETISVSILNAVSTIEDTLYEQLVSLIFSIASNNRFYSKVYARLYTTLKVDVPIITSYFDRILRNYLEMFKSIESCNPDKDYNKFCEINKQNEHRRSITSFIVNCMILDNIDVKVINELIYYLQKLMLESVDDIMKIEEITENFFILVQIGLDKIVLSDDWGNIYEYIQQNSKNKEFNNKIRFKFMDLLDLTS